MKKLLTIAIVAAAVVAVPLALAQNAGQSTPQQGDQANPAQAEADAKAIVLRIEAALVNEAGWLLAEGGTTAEGIDTALRLGLNFPRGPFASARRHGVSEVLAELCRLQAAAPAPLKARYAASPGLLTLQ